MERLDFIWSAVKYPTLVAWNAAKSWLWPEWSRAELIYNRDTPPEWLEEFLSACPERLLSGFAPSIWTPDAHSQSIVYGFAPTDNSVSFRWEYLDLPDGQTAALSWAEPKGDIELSLDAPVCLLVPGLEGRGATMGNGATAAVKQGMRAVALGRRGHDEGVELQQPKWSLTDPADFRAVLKCLKSRYPDAPLVALTVSGGGGVVVRYAKEHSEDNLLDGYVSISPSFHPMKLLAIHNDYAPWPYNSYMLGLLKEVMEKNKDVMSGHVDMGAVRRCSTIHDFIINVDLKLNKIDNIDDYWEMAYPLNPATGLPQVPGLMIASKDDPFFPVSVIPFDVFTGKSNTLALLLSEKGGHCGFLEGWRANHWGYEVGLTFLKAVAGRSARKRKPTTC